MQGDFRALVASVLSACNRATIDVDSDVQGSIKALIIVSMKYINKQELFATVMDKASFVDWQYIDNARPPGQNILGDSSIWLKMMHFADFGPLEMPDSEMRVQYPPLWCIYNSLRSSGAFESTHTGPARGYSMNFSDACKMCILNNIEGVHCRSEWPHPCQLGGVQDTLPNPE